uniref:Uncharacterized protein n=1 Tax=Glossina palpalis gambiensis TaxID=67801 RepID=A0A1B0B245_9MUSC
ASYNSWLAVFKEIKADAPFSEIKFHYNPLSQSGVTESKFRTPGFKSELMLLNVGSKQRIRSFISNTQKQGDTIDAFRLL